jgi:hypothetical protein
MFSKYIYQVFLYVFHLFLNKCFLIPPLLVIHLNTCYRKYAP